MVGEPFLHDFLHRKRPYDEYGEDFNAPQMSLNNARRGYDVYSKASGNNPLSNFLKGMMSGGGSYEGGSGPAAGSFRGAQEAGLGSTSAAGSATPGMSNLFGMTSGEGAGALGPGMLYAYLIARGKMMENERLSEDPDDPAGNFGLAMLAPSGKQIMADPKGMGLPTLLGVPFITPFTASDESKQEKPEWAGLMGGGK